MAAAREAISRLLTALGCSRIQTAASGAAAIQAITAAAAPFDVVICDLSMPTDDGLVLLRRLAALDVKPAVILMSGGEAMILESARRLGARFGLRVLGAVQKPVSAAVLSGLLHAATAPGPGAVPPPPALLTAAEVRAGLDSNRFELWFQPQYHIRSHRVVGAEALLRLRDEAGGILGPASFIAPAERTGLIDRLTDFALQAAVAQGAAWKAGGQNLTIAVNLSPASLHDVTLPDRAAALCLERRLDPGTLVFELTESFLASDITAVLDITTRLRLMGFGLAIDDFGTGYASLAQLDLLPFQQLKIDRSLVQHAVGDPRARTILSNTVRMASELKMSIVAEGVETELMFQMAAGLSCDIAQGYLIARPMPGHELEGWLARHGGDTDPSRLSGANPGDGAGPVVAIRPVTSASRVDRFAHDVASPLMLLMMLSESLLSDPDLGREQSEDISALHRAATDVASMVKALRRQGEAASTAHEPGLAPPAPAPAATEPGPAAEPAERIDVYAAWVRELSNGVAPAAPVADAADPLARLGRELEALSAHVAHRESELHDLFELVRQVQAGASLDEVLTRIFAGFRGIIPYDRICCAFLSDDRTRLVEYWAASELGPIRLKPGYQRPMAGSSLQSILSSSRPRIINDLEAYLAAKPESAATRLIVEEGGRSSLTCPLFVEGEPVGFLFFTSRLKDSYVEQHESAFIRIAGQLATVVDKSRLVERLVGSHPLLHQRP